MKRAGILAVSCALVMSTGAFAQSGPPSGQNPAGSSGSPGTTSPGQPTPPTAGTDRALPTAEPAEQARTNDTQQFIKKAAVANMAEIQLGQLAGTKAESPDVKQFAQMMVDQHTKALEELRQVATASNVALPTELDKKHQKLHDKLSKLSGHEFDREYMDAMVDGHKDVAKMLEKQSKRSASSESVQPTTGTSGSTGSPTATGTSGTATAAAGGQEASAWASKTLPAVQSHLQQAQQIEQSLKAENKSKSEQTTGAADDAGSGTGSGADSAGSTTPPE